MYKVPSGETLIIIKIKGFFIQCMIPINPVKFRVNAFDLFYTQTHSLTFTVGRSPSPMGKGHRIEIRFFSTMVDADLILASGTRFPFAKLPLMH